MRAVVTAVVGIAAIMGALARSPASAETVKIGTLRVTAGGPLYIAKDKGYFAKQGLDAELVFTDAPQTMGQAVLSGDVDFSLAGSTAALYNIAGQGKLRIIAGSTDEWPGFQAVAVAASNQAYDRGLKSIADLKGRSIAIPAVGTVPHYDLSVLAAKYGFDDRSVKILQLGSLSNAVAAVVGGNADATITAFTSLKTAVQAKKLHLLAFIGDEMRMQIQVVIASGETADTKRGMVERFLTAFRQGTRDYHDAFTGAGEVRQDGATAPQVYAILSKYMDQPLDAVKLGVGHYDREARLDQADVLRPIAWFKSRGMVKPEVDGNAIIDRSYVTALPDLEAKAPRQDPLKP